jgi:signal transduction histidine kinase
MEEVDTPFLAVEREKASPSKAQSFSARQTALLTLLVGLGSYITARLGGTLGLPPQGASALWPGCALLVSVLLLLPRGMWPALIPAGLAGFVVHDLQVGFPPLTIVLFILADIIEITIVAFGLRYWFDGIPRLNSLKALAKYSLVAVLLGPLIGTFVGAFAISGYFFTNWRMFFFSEAMAFLTVTPAFLSWAHPDSLQKNVSPQSRLEGAALIGTVICLGYVVFFVHWRMPLPAVLPYSLVPVLLWAALRFGSKGVSTAMLVIVFSSIWGSIHRSGPFTAPEPVHYVLSLQLFWVFATAPFLLLAVVAEEREQARLAEREVRGRLISAQEQERTRIARELHDDICQRLALLSIGIQTVTEVLPSGPMQLGVQLEQIGQQCSTLTGDVQALSHELHPSILENLGLVSAAKSFCRKVSEQSGSAVEFTEENIPVLPRDISLSLFRVIQEALYNAVKYSGERRFEVHLHGEPGEIGLEVSDRGVGFDLAAMKGHKGLGLVSMAERVHMVNGTFSVCSRPSCGTQIRVRVPFAKQQNASARAEN